MKNLEGLSPRLTADFMQSTFLWLGCLYLNHWKNEFKGFWSLRNTNFNCQNIQNSYLKIFFFLSSENRQDGFTSVIDFYVLTFTSLCFGTKMKCLSWTQLRNETAKKCISYFPMEFLWFFKHLLVLYILHACFKKILVFLSPRNLNLYIL